MGASPYERSEEFIAYRNGFRDREITTRIGAITLRVLRNLNGNFSTNLFECYQRSEQALILCMIEMVVSGVPTCNIEQVTEELCGSPFQNPQYPSFERNWSPW